jgi:hypothetical protein
MTGSTGLSWVVQAPRALKARAMLAIGHDEPLIPEVLIRYSTVYIYICIVVGEG